MYILPIPFCLSPMCQVDGAMDKNPSSKAPALSLVSPSLLLAKANRNASQDQNEKAKQQTISRNMILYDKPNI